MRKLVAVLLIFSGALAKAGENETSRFLGPEADWEHARLSLYDTPMLDLGYEIAVTGSGSACVRVLGASSSEERFLFAIEKKEARALFDLASSEDLAAMTIKEEPGHPDEHRFTLSLENALGVTKKLSAFASQAPPGFRKIEKELRSLEKKCRGKEPDYRGKQDGFFRPFPGIQVTVALYSGRPDPGFELLLPQDWEKVRSLLTDLTPIPRPERKEAPLGFRGFLVTARGLASLPKWISVYKGSIQLGDSPRDMTYKKDDRGLEDWLKAEAKKRGIEIEEKR